LPNSNNKAITNVLVHAMSSLSKQFSFWMATEAGWWRWVTNGC